MPLTLKARIPFPEQAATSEPLDVVFPQVLNPKLYEALAKLPEGSTQRITAKNGIAIVVEPITNHPGTHERINAALRVMTQVSVTRKGAEIALATFEIHDGNRAMFGEESVKSILAEMTHGSTTNPPTTKDTIVANTGDTIVANTGDTKVPAKPGAARSISREEKDRIMGRTSTADNAKEAADAALERFFKRR